MSNRIKEIFDAHAQVLGKARENAFSSEYQPKNEHEMLRKEYYALTSQIIAWVWEHFAEWQEANPKKFIVPAASVSKISDKSAISMLHLAHLQYASIPEEYLFETSDINSHLGPYKGAELKLRNICKDTVSFQTQIWFDFMKSSRIPEDREPLWRRWEAVLKKRETLQPQSVHGRRRQIEWGFAHGFESIRQVTSQVIDAFYDLYEHLPATEEEYTKVKNDIKNYLIHLSLLTTPLEIFFETLSNKANENLIPFFAYDTEVEPPELTINVPPVNGTTRKKIYDTLYKGIGKSDTKKTSENARLGCPASIPIPGRHQPVVISKIVDFYLDTYKKLLEHPQAKEWYKEELAQKYEKLVSFF